MRHKKSRNTSPPSSFVEQVDAPLSSTSNSFHPDESMNDSNVNLSSASSFDEDATISQEGLFGPNLSRQCSPVPTQDVSMTQDWTLPMDFLKIDSNALPTDRTQCGCPTNQRRWRCQKLWTQDPFCHTIKRNPRLILQRPVVDRNFAPAIWTLIWPMVILVC